MKRFLVSAVLVTALSTISFAQHGDEGMITPSQAVVPVGAAPGMQVKLVKSTPEEKIYAIIFRKGDDAMSGLTDFAIANGIHDAHFTGIGAVSGATLGYLNLNYKKYRLNQVQQQVEVLSLIGDIADINGKPAVHMHTVLGKEDGSTLGGHVFALKVNPTLEVFVTANTVPLRKRHDDASGMKLIDPTQ